MMGLGHSGELGPCAKLLHYRGDRHRRNQAGQVHEATLGVGGFGNTCPQGPGEIQGCLKYHSLLGSLYFIHMYIHVSTPVCKYSYIRRRWERNTTGTV